MDIVKGADSYLACIEGEVAGVLEFTASPGLVVFTHIEVDEVFAGRGVGSALARRGLDDAMEQGARVTPLCPFVAAFIERNPGYQPLVTA